MNPATVAALIVTDRVADVDKAIEDFETAHAGSSIGRLLDAAEQQRHDRSFG